MCCPALDFKLFDQLDANHDGKVTWEEFNGYLTETHKKRGQVRGDKWLKTLLHTIKWSKDGTESKPAPPDTSFGRNPAGSSPAASSSARKLLPNLNLLNKIQATKEALHGEPQLYNSGQQQPARHDPHAHHNLRDSETALRESQVVGIDEDLVATETTPLGPSASISDGNAVAAGDVELEETKVKLSPAPGAKGKWPIPVV